jgi:tetratricopeptide (TPR) repeat protein
MLELVLISLAAAVAPPFVVAARRAMLSHRLSLAMSQSDIEAIVQLCDQAADGSWLPCMNRSEASFYKAMAYCGRRIETQARECFHAIDPVELHPSQKQYLPLLEASLRSMGGDPAAGLGILRKVDASQLDPVAEATFRLLEAELLAQQDKPAEAATLLEPWLDRPIAPSLLALIRNNWAWFSLEAGGDAATALHRARQALAVMPDSGPFHGTYGVALHLTGGDPAEAIEAIEKALQHPERTLPAYIAADHYYLGQCFASLGWRDQAIHHYTEALELAPESRWARLAGAQIEAVERSPAEWRWPN